MWSILSPVNVLAQRSEASATLFGWEQRVRNFMLDRSHNYGGTNYDRGLFRQHINDMSPEHEIDLLTYRYTLTDDYKWELSNHAYRLSTGSLNATQFAIENEIKDYVDVDSSNEITIEGYQEENLRAQRFLFYLGYNHTFAGQHHLGIIHTLTEEKSDLDATFYYRYGNFRNGMAEVDFTIMDWGSNVVEGLADKSRNRYNDDYPVTHHYLVNPELLSIKLASPRWSNFKAEFVAGVQTYSRKKVEQYADTTNFIDEEWAHYVGGLIEYSNTYFTVGLTYQRKFSKLKRVPAPDSNYELDFGNWQTSNVGGGYITSRIKSFRLEQWFWVEHNTDRLEGNNVPDDLSPLGIQRIPFNYVENRIKFKSRVLYDPQNSGFKTGLEFHADYIYPRGEKANNGVQNFDFRRVYPIIRNRNDRLTYTIGYRFSKTFYLLAGVSYDLDGDAQSGIGLPRITGTPTWFDGGFGRFAISW